MIAICPAGEEYLLRGLRDGTLELRAGDRARADLEAWLSEHDLRDAVGLLGAKPLILIHAEGDERIPSEFSAELYERAADPRKLIIAPGRPPSLRPARRGAAGRGAAVDRTGAAAGRPGLISRRVPSR